MCACIGVSFTPEPFFLKTGQEKNPAYKRVAFPVGGFSLNRCFGFPKLPGVAKDPGILCPVCHPSQPSFFGSVLVSSTMLYANQVTSSLNTQRVATDDITNQPKGLRCVRATGSLGRGRKEGRQEGNGWLRAASALPLTLARNPGWLVGWLYDCIRLRLALKVHF